MILKKCFQTVKVHTIHGDAVPKVAVIQDDSRVPHSDAPAVPARLRVVLFNNIHDGAQVLYYTSKHFRHMAHSHKKGDK